MSYVLAPIEQKTALQIIDLLMTYSDEIRFNTIFKSVNGGLVANYNAIDNLKSIDLVKDRQKFEYGPWNVSLKEHGN